jgi:3-oxoacyl-[acyl-carrier-protein] synthase II
MRRRVVITAMAVFSSLGRSCEEILESLQKGRTAFTRSVHDDSVVVCPVRDFDLKAVTGPFKERRYLNRGAQFSVAAAWAALQQSGLKAHERERAGLFVGAGPNLDLGGEFPGIGKGRLDDPGIMALWILRFLPNTAASVIAKLGGVHGENMTLTTACAAGLQAVGQAYRKIRNGYLDTALAGGGDSRLSEGGILAYKKARAVYAGEAEPAAASRPFDKARQGFVMGEGGAFFVLEERESARQRGAKILAEISGFGASLDGYSLTDPEPTGRFAEAAVRQALAEAEIAPAALDAVSAHGTGTFLNDDMEAAMLLRLTGKEGPFVMAPKSWLGHASAACGALELAVVLTCLANDYLPEIRNLQEPCQSDVRFVRAGMFRTLNTVLIENFGFGGQNCALVVRKTAGEDAAN